MKRAGGVLLICAIMLVGCATHRAEKPLLTAGAYRHIAAACHADHAVFYRGTKGLPHVEFTYGDAAKQVGDEGSPIFKCMGADLQHYRYDFFSFKADPPVAE